MVKKPIQDTKKEGHAWKKSIMKLIIMVLAIVVALSLHSVVERLLDNYIVSVSWTPERETLLRLLYPVVAILLVGFLAVHYSAK